jgi:hypothetical protein
LDIVHYFSLGYLQLYKLLLTIVSYFILGYFLLCDPILGYFWLLKFISPYVIIDNFRLL